MEPKITKVQGKMINMLRMIILIKILIRMNTGFRRELLLKWHLNSSLLKQRIHHCVRGWSRRGRRLILSRSATTRPMT